MPLREPSDQSRKLPALGATVFQDLHDCLDGVPIPGGDFGAEEFVYAAEVGDGFHVAAVFATNEASAVAEESDEPLVLWRECDGHGGPKTAGGGQYGDEADDARARRRGRKGIVAHEGDEIAAFADGDIGGEAEPVEQGGAKLCYGTGLPDDEGSGGADVYDIVVLQFADEEAGAEGAVSADIHASQKNDDGHKGSGAKILT